MTANKPLPDPKPQETPPVSYSGEIYFSCCGTVHKNDGKNQSMVTCPYCKTSYIIQIEPRECLGGRWEKGKILYMTKDLETQAGSGKIQLKKGTKVRVGHDLYGVITNDDNVTLIEIESPSLVNYGKKLRILLAPVPNDYLSETHE
jgi:uncharacterized Zn ribbon protein